MQRYLARSLLSSLAKETILISQVSCKIFFRVSVYFTRWCCYFWLWSCCCLWVLALFTFFLSRTPPGEGTEWIWPLQWVEQPAPCELLLLLIHRSRHHSPTFLTRVQVPDQFRLPSIRHSVDCSGRGLSADRRPVSRICVSEAELLAENAALPWWGKNYTIIITIHIYI